MKVGLRTNPDRVQPCQNGQQQRSVKPHRRGRRISSWQPGQRLTTAGGGGFNSDRYLTFFDKTGLPSAPKRTGADRQITK